MTLDDYNAFCGSLAYATHVVQWGGADVWKIDGKVFAVGGWQDEKAQATKTIAVSFKVSHLVYEVLKDQPGVRPAPYLASRGMIWLQRTGSQTINDAAFKDHLRESYRLVSLGLPKKRQAELGLNQSTPNIPLIRDTPTQHARPKAKTSARSRRGKS